MKKYIQPEVQERKSLINNPIMIIASNNGENIIGQGEPEGTGEAGVTSGDAKLRDEWSDGLW